MKSSVCQKPLARTEEGVTDAGRSSPRAFCTLASTLFTLLLKKEEVSCESVLGLRFLELRPEPQGAGCTEPRGFPVLIDPVLSLPHQDGSHDLRVCEQQNQGLMLPNEFAGSRPPDRPFRNLSDVLYVHCPIQ